MSPFDVQDWALEIRPDGVAFASFGLGQVITLLRDQSLFKENGVSVNKAEDYLRFAFEPLVDAHYDAHIAAWL